MSSKKPPLHPDVASHRREALQGFTIIGLALLAIPLVGVISLAGGWWGTDRHGLNCC